MTKINNQFTSIDKIEAVKDLDQESATAISGGVVTVTDVTLYSESNKQGFRFPSNKAIEDLSEFGFNDATGSITIANDQTWRFYSDANFQGTSFIVRPGETADTGDFGKTISSFRALE
jgi:hypothetical protein